MARSFREAVESLVVQIPPGFVMTYGQVASLIGHPRAARQVGGVAHFGDVNLPWHRLVNKAGRLAAGYPGGRLAQKEHLEAEGVEVMGDKDTYYVDVERLIWWP